MDVATTRMPSPPLRTPPTPPFEPDDLRGPIDPGELRAVLSSLSHELCRPLISLRAGFDLLLNDAARPISPDQKGHVRTMASLCDDLLRLTRSYLDYAGLVQGSRPLCLGEFSLGAVVREIDHEFRPIAAARSIDLACALEGADVTVTTDVSRCQQVFGNLVANALKYSPKGGSVWVTGKADDARDGGWSVSVADTGPGIPVDDVERVFAPFYRLPREEKSRVEGNGLGLAVCRELMNQLGGEIELRSREGEGTVVTVRFPAGPPNPPAATGI